MNAMRYRSTQTLVASCFLALSACGGGGGDDTPGGGTGGSFAGAPSAGSGGSAPNGGAGGAAPNPGGTGGVVSTAGSGGKAGTSGAGGTGGGAAGTGGSAGKGGSGGSAGGGANPGKVFSSCRFHFGAIDEFARENPNIAAQIDYFVPGWMGTNGDTFDQGYVCQEGNPGGPLAGKVPVIVSYVAASYAKRHHNPRLNDCNVRDPHLCVYGAAFINQNLTNILNVYRSFAQGYAGCWGTTKPIVFLMEPDFYQYTIDSQTAPLTPARAGEIMSQFVGAIRQHLPNAFFSMDISPWVAPNNGADHGAQWFANFDMSLFTFVNTSGGRTEAANTRIRQSNQMTWAGVRQASGKPILADSGYTANGASTGHDTAWDNVSNINARIANGVVGMAQYNPNSTWGTTISGIRSQLSMPTSCP